MNSVSPWFTRGEMRETFLKANYYQVLRYELEVLQKQLSIVLSINQNSNIR